MPKYITPVLTLDIRKNPANMPRAERQITDMLTYKEIYVLPEGIEPMKEWITHVFNPFKREDESILIYASTEEEAIKLIEKECYRLGWKWESIILNHILNYYKDENGDFQSILTKEFSFAVGLKKIKRIRDGEEYFNAIAPKVLTSA